MKLLLFAPKMHLSFADEARPELALNMRSQEPALVMAMCCSAGDCIVSQRCEQVSPLRQTPLMGLMGLVMWTVALAQQTGWCTASLRTTVQPEYSRLLIPVNPALAGKEPAFLSANCYGTSATIC